MYQIIINPIIVKVKPPTLNWLSLMVSIFRNIFFIFDGNKAYTIPSINKKRPKAMINSFISYSYWDGLTFTLPKNLKNSLSGDKTNEVSPPINAFS